MNGAKHEGDNGINEEEKNIQSDEEVMKKKGQRDKETVTEGRKD